MYASETLLRETADHAKTFVDVETVVWSRGCI